MRAVTLRQPWAVPVAWGLKTVENRMWSPLPGVAAGEPFAIHAGVSHRWDAAGQASPMVQTAWLQVCKMAGFDPPPLRPSLCIQALMPFGAIVAVARVTRVCPRFSQCGPDGRGSVCDPWAAWGQCHWHLADVQRLLEPVYCRGYQRMWTVAEQDEETVRAQLEES